MTLSCHYITVFHQVFVDFQQKSRIPIWIQKGISLEDVTTEHVIRNTARGNLISLLQQHHLCPLVEGWHSSTSSHHPTHPSIWSGAKDNSCGHDYFKTVIQNTSSPIDFLLSSFPSKKAGESQAPFSFLEMYQRTISAPKPFHFWPALESLPSEFNHELNSEWHHCPFFNDLSSFMHWPLFEMS